MAAGDFQGTYSADKVIIAIGGVNVSGFADGDFVSAKFDEDRYMKKSGADGEVGRSRNPSKAGTIDITLSQTSQANDGLSALFSLDAIGTYDAPISISVADLSGRSLATASKAWIKTSPDLTFGKEIGDRVWVIDCADLSIFVGGNN